MIQDGVKYKLMILFIQNNPINNLNSFHLLISFIKIFKRKKNENLSKNTEQKMFTILIYLYLSFDFF